MMKLEMWSWGWPGPQGTFPASCWKRRSQAISIESPCSRSVLREADLVPCHLTAPGIRTEQLLQVESWGAPWEEAGPDWQSSVISQVGRIQLVQMQVELSSKLYLLSVLWSWLNFLQLLQEIRKSPNEREAGGQHLFALVRRKCKGKWIHSWAN